MVKHEVQPRSILFWLYLLNAAVLITHEIDSAYWHEWQLFGIPGGIQLFLGLNLILVIVVLYGLQAVTLGRASAVGFSWILVAGGLFAGAIHSLFLLQGDEAFQTPVSIALLAAIFVLSIAQGAVLLRTRNRT